MFESVKDLVDLLLLDSDASVGNSDLNFVRRGIECFNHDAPVRGREFHAVLDQVPEDLLQTRWIAFDVNALRVQLKLGFDSFLCDILPANLIGALQDLVHANNLQTELEFPFGNARDVEKIVN